MHCPAAAAAPHPALSFIDRDWVAQPASTLLLTGFNTGQRFITLWQHWRSHAQRPAMLHVVGLLSDAEMAALPAALRQAALDGDRAAAALLLADQCDGLDSGFHRILLAPGHVSLTLCVGERAAQLAQLIMQADCVWAEPPSMDVARNSPWDKWQLKALARLCRRGAALCFGGTEAPAREALRDAGFVDVQTQPQGLLTRYDPRWTLRHSPAPTQAPGRCAVIGAGLAGASVAHALAVRGWQVDVYEAGATAAAGASGLPLGLVVPHHSVDDSPRSRMSRKGTRLMRQHAQALLQAGQDWQPSGVMERAVLADGLSGEEEELLSGSEQGLWHGLGAWIKPQRMVQAWLAHPRIQLHCHAAVQTLVRDGPQWRLADAQGAVLGCANAVAFANAHGCVDLLQCLMAAAPEATWVPGLHDTLQALQRLHGTLSLGPCPAEFSSAPSPVPPYPVNGHGSFASGIPTDNGPHWYAGATFQTDAALHADLPHEQAANQRKLAALLPDVAARLAPAFDSGQVQSWQSTRCVSHDRLPLVGALEEGPTPTLWISAAMGARGLSFAALCAELLAARIGGEPLPMEAGLARGLDVGRGRRAKAAAASAQ